MEAFRVTKRVEDVPAAKPVEASPGGGIFADWVLPILLGLAIGAAAWWAWPHVMHSQSRRIVDRARADEIEDIEPFEAELRARGAGARDEVAGAMRSLDARDMDGKVWIARLLAGDPWFATVSLKEIVKDASAAKADRRAAACALVDSQNKEVDPELVLPVFEEWLLDLAVTDHGHPIARIERMGQQGMLGAQWEARVRKALLALAARSPRPVPADMADSVEEDRAAALLALVMFIPDDEVTKLLWGVAKDETDAELARINSIRALSEGHVHDAAVVGDWEALGKSANDVVRQTTADNLHRAPLPEYDRVLVPLQFDANPMARSGAIDSQIKRRRPTMLERFDELMEDSDELVRVNTMFAAGVFKAHTDGSAQRAAMIIRYLETSEDPVDVEGAVVALKVMTGSDEIPGFVTTDVHVNMQSVEETALRAFMADKANRKQAADTWRSRFGAAAVWTDGDRAKVLEKLLKHADPKNRERAQLQLDALKK